MSDPASPHRTARRWIPIGLLVALVVAGVAIAGPWRRDRDRPEQADRTREASVLVDVEHRQLVESVTTRGAVRSAWSAGIAAPTAGEGERATVVTAVRLDPGDQVAGGQAPIEFNGRPVIVLPLEIPLYRDLVPGRTGPDVGSFQDGLRALGHAVPEGEDGTFGPATQAASAALFETAGYPVPYTLGDRAALDGARRDLETRVATARTTADTARASGLADPAAEADLRSALAERSAFDAREGVKVAAAEIAAVPGFPAVALQLRAEVGSVVEAGASVLEMGPPDVEVVAQLLQGGGDRQIPEGTEATVSTSIGSTSSCVAGPTTAPSPATDPDPATGGGAGEAPYATDATDGDGSPAAEGTDGDGPVLPGLEVVLRCGPEIGAVDVGRDVQVTAEIPRTPGPVLSVPYSAVTTGADGQSSVLLDRDGERTRVGVDTGVEVGGYVEITPRDGGRVESGAKAVARR